MDGDSRSTGIRGGGFSSSGPDKSLEAIKASVKDTVLGRGKARSQDDIIQELNPKLRGWCNYHRSAMSTRTFYYLDAYLFRTLFRWAMRRHGDKGKKWIADRWHPRGNRKWEFCTEESITDRWT